MENMTTDVVKIGATTYTVECVLSSNARETAEQAIKRLLLQKVRSECNKSFRGNARKDLI